MKMNLSKIYVNDSKSNRNYNYNRMLRNMIKNIPEGNWVEEGGYAFTGTGAKDVRAILKWRGLSISEILALEVSDSHVINRFDAALVEDVLSNMPDYASLDMSLEITADGGRKSELRFSLVKEGADTYFIKSNVEIF